MSDSLRVFNNPEFGSVRTVTVDGEPWFVGKDVADMLGYADTNRAVAQHVDREDRKPLRRKAYGDLFPTLWTGENDFSDKVVINESGLYSLIFNSKLDSAKEFKRWVTHDVLPAIRKTGTYTARTMTPNEIIAAIAADNVEKERRLKSLEDGFHEAMEVLAEPPEAEEWRKKIYQKVSRYCARHDLDYTETWEKLYGQLEIRAGCNLATLQTRRRNRARIAGATASAVNAINRLDCIAADKRLREIFTGIVKEFSARRILASSVAPETLADPHVLPALA